MTNPPIQPQLDFLPAVGGRLVVAVFVQPLLLHRNLRGVLDILHIDSPGLAGQIHRTGGKLLGQGVGGILGAAEVEVVGVHHIRHPIPLRSSRLHHLVEGVGVVSEGHVSVGILLLPDDLEGAGSIGGIGFDRFCAVFAGTGVVLVDAEGCARKADIIVARLHLVEGIALVGGDAPGIAGVLPLGTAAGIVAGIVRPFQLGGILKTQAEGSLLPVDLVRHIAGDAVGILEHQGRAVRDPRGGDGVGGIIPFILTGLGLVGPAPVGDRLPGHPFFLFLIPHGRVQLYTALDQGGIDRIACGCASGPNGIGIGHGIDQGQGVRTLHQVLALRVEDDGVVHDPVGIVPAAGFVHYLGLIGPLLSLAGGADLPAVQLHFGGVGQRLGFALLLRVIHLTGDGEGEFRPGLDGITLGLWLNIQGDDAILIGAADGVLIGAVGAGDGSVFAHLQFHVQITPAGELQAFQGHALRQGVDQGQLFVPFTHGGLYLPGQLALIADGGCVRAAVAVGLDHAGLIIGVLRHGLLAANLDIVIEFVAAGGGFCQIHRGGIGEGQLGGSLRGNQALGEMDGEEGVGQSLVIDPFLTRRCLILADLLEGVGIAIGGQEGDLLRGWVIGVGAAHRVAAVVRPGQVGSPGGDLAVGHPLVGVAPLAFGHIVHNGGARGQAALGDGQGHRPGDGHGGAVIGDCARSHTLGNAAATGNGHIRCAGGLLAIQSQLGLVVDGLIVPRLGFIGVIGDGILVRVDAVFLGGFEGDAGDLAIFVHDNRVFAGIRSPPVVFLDGNITGSQPAEHFIRQHRARDIQLAGVDGDGPADFLIPGIAAALGQLYFVRFHSGFRTNGRPRLSLAGGEGGAVGDGGRGAVFILGHSGGVFDGIGLGVLAVFHPREGDASDLAVSILGEGTTGGWLDGEVRFRQGGEHLVGQGSSRNVQIAGVDGDGPIDLVGGTVKLAPLVQLYATDGYGSGDLLLVAGFVWLGVKGGLIGHGGAIPAFLYRGIIGDGVCVLVDTVFRCGKGDVGDLLVFALGHGCALGGIDHDILRGVLHQTQHFVCQLGPGDILLVVVHSDRPLDIAGLIGGYLTVLIQRVAEILIHVHSGLVAVGNGLALGLIFGGDGDFVLRGNDGLRLGGDGKGVGDLVDLAGNVRGIITVHFLLGGQLWQRKR